MSDTLIAADRPVPAYPEQLPMPHALFAAAQFEIQSFVGWNPWFQLARSLCACLVVLWLAIRMFREDDRIAGVIVG